MRQNLFITYLLLLPILIACGAETTPATNEAVNETSSTTISVTTRQFELGKMELGSFSNQPFHKVVKATGRLDVPPENKSTISTYFEGFVKTISLIPGQKVKKGQRLFTVENPDYINVQQNYLEAKSQLNYLKSDYERQKNLASENVSSQKTFLKAESDYKVTFAKYESLKKRLRLMNINPSTISETNLRSTIYITAPISGYVTSVLATKGMFLNASDIALTIMNTDQIHVELTIFEQDLNRVFVGQNVSFNLQNDSIKRKATVHLINKAIDPENRSINVHCDLLNKEDAASLTPGMFIDAEIYTKSDSSLALPIGAVVSIGNKSYILVKQGSTKETIELELTEVRVGESNEDFVEILNAGQLKKGLEIMTEGAFNLIKE